MAGTTKVSVEKALNKIREADMQKSETTRTDEEIAELDESIKRMRAQRLRLERHEGKHHQESPAKPASPPRYTFGKLVSRLFWFLRS